MHHQSKFSGNAPVFLRFLIAAFALFVIGSPAAWAQQAADIHRAATATDTVELQKILDADGEAWKRTDKAGNQALHVAAWGGHADAVKLLLDRGAEVDARGFDDWTALHFAASKDHAEVCKLLLEAGADREALNGVSRTAMQMAGEKAREVIGKFVMSTAGADEYLRAVFEGKLEEVKRLLEENPRLIDAKAAGVTALMMACISKNPAMIRLLLEKGADVNVLSDSEHANFRGTSALSFSCGIGHVEGVRLLLEHEAEVNPRDIKTAAAAPIVAQPPLLRACEMATMDYAKAKEMADAGEIDLSRLSIEGLKNNPLSDQEEALEMLRTTQAFLEATRVMLPEETRDAKRQIISLLLEAGADVNEAASAGTPLGIAIYAGDVDTVRLLLERGADPNAEFSGIAPLKPLAAALFFQSTGNTAVEMMNLLLEAGADPLAGEGEQNGFAMAAVLENEVIFRKLLEVVDVPALTPADQCMLLSSLVRRPSWLKEVLDLGCDVNAQDGKKMTALHRAFGNFDSVKLLLAAGADPNVKDYAGFTPLHNAAEDGHAECMPLFLEKGADLEARTDNDATPLGIAAMAGDVEATKLLLEAGANPNVQNKFGVTPLFVAAGSGSLEVVELLIEAGAKVDHIGEKSAFSALMAAAAGADYHRKLAAESKAQEGFVDRPPSEVSDEAYREVVKTLLDHGADIDLRGPAVGATALHFAAGFCDTEMVELLLDRGAGLEVTPSKSRNTPLWAAISQGNEDIFQLLIDRGANIHAIGDLEQSVLGAAASYNRVEMAKTLLQKGADIEARDQSGVTPLFQAVYAGASETIELLLEHGADVEAAAKDGKTSIDIAKSKGNDPLVRLLNRHRK
jgi:ankyrin repeat protein